MAEESREPKIAEFVSLLSTRGDIGAFLLTYSASYVFDSVYLHWNSPSLAGLIGGIGVLGLKSLIQALVEALRARTGRTLEERALVLIETLSRLEDTELEHVAKNDFDMWKKGLTDDSQLEGRLKKIVARIVEKENARIEPKESGGLQDLGPVSLDSPRSVILAKRAAVLIDLTKELAVADSVAKTIMLDQGVWSPYG